MHALEVVSQEVRDRCLIAGPRHTCPDIDELYKQAGRLGPLFQAKLEKWASATGGTGHAGTKKSSDRAVQKVVRSYGGDASRLLDICRGALIFRDVQTLCDTLELIS